jgi:hypothetical protein
VAAADGLANVSPRLSNTLQMSDLPMAADAGARRPRVTPASGETEMRCHLEFATPQAQMRLPAFTAQCVQREYDPLAPAME